jgi:hypothetical protein
VTMANFTVVLTTPEPATSQQGMYSTRLLPLAICQTCHPMHTNALYGMQVAV